MHRFAFDLAPTAQALEIVTDAAHIARYVELVYARPHGSRPAVAHRAEFLTATRPVAITFDGTSIAPPFPLPPDHPWQSAAYVCDQLVRRALAKDREWVTLYGSAVALHARSVLLLGSSGSGKTTLALALAVRGARLYGDEMPLLHRTTGRLSAFRRPLLVREGSLAALERRELVECIAASPTLAASGPTVYAYDFEAFATDVPLPLAAAFLIAGTHPGQAAVRELREGLLPPRLAGTLKGTPCYRLDVGEPFATAALVERTVDDL